MDGSIRSNNSAEIQQTVDDGENDNTISEELSRFSSASASQSSSCTSITNPFYEGPPEETAAATAQTVIIPKPKPGNGRRTSSTSGSSHRRDLMVNHPCPHQGHHRQGSLSQGTRAVGGEQSTSYQPEKVEQRVIIFWDLGYLCTCFGFLQLLQLILTGATFACLMRAGALEHGLLNLPLSWHFRIMIFILVLTFLVSFSSFCGNITSLIQIFGFEWTFFDMIIYSLFAFLYLVGSSLVASAFDFYQKMKTDVSQDTIDQLITTVILGYVCMVLYGFTAFFSYRKWKVQYKLYQRRKLIEEDEIDL